MKRKATPEAPSYGPKIGRDVQAQDMDRFWKQNAYSSVLNWKGERKMMSILSD